MTLSVQAAKDDVAFYEAAIEGADKKLARMTEEVKRSKRQLTKQLAAAKRELVAAEKAEAHTAPAGSPDHPHTKAGVH